MSNINQKVAVLATLQAAGADVSLDNRILRITGVDAIPVLKIQTGKLIASVAGLAVPYTITSTAAVAALTTYEIAIVQETADRVYTAFISYTTGASAPSDTAFYAAIGALIQEYIDGGQLLGTVVAGASNVVFTGTVDAPLANTTVSNLSIAAGTKTLTAAGSSATDAAPRVLTAGAAHGLTVGRAYRITISGVTSTGAADMNKTYIGIVLSATTIALIGTTATGAVVTTSATMTVSQEGKQDFNKDATLFPGYSPTTNYIGVDLEFLSNDPVQAGVVINQMVLGTLDDTTKGGAFYNALLAALDGTSVTETLAVV